MHFEDWNTAGFQHPRHLNIKPKYVYIAVFVDKIMLLKIYIFITWNFFCQILT